MKLKVAENVNKSSKTNSFGVYITGHFATVKHAKVTGLWFMEIMEMHGCSNLNYFVATYQLYCLVIDKALLTLITATLMRTFTFAKMNLALKVYGGADPALQDKRIGPTPGFHLSIPGTQRMKKIGRQGISEAGQIFFMSMDKHDLNQIGPMVLEHLNNHANGFYRYFMKYY